MIKMLLVAVVFIGPVSLSAQNRINIHINNFQNNKGACIVCLYNDPGAFSNEGKPLQCTTVGIANKITKAVFDNVQAGTYAVLVIHDANNNRRFDTNFLGIPKEGYGASKNKLPFAAAPKFEENKFAVIDGSQTECAIRLRYIF